MHTSKKPILILIAIFSLLSTTAKSETLTYPASPLGINNYIQTNSAGPWSILKNKTRLKVKQRLMRHSAHKAFEVTISTDLTADDWPYIRHALTDNTGYTDWVYGLKYSHAKPTNDATIQLLHSKTRVWGVERHYWMRSQFQLDDYNMKGKMSWALSDGTLPDDKLSLKHFVSQLQLETDPDGYFIAVITGHLDPGGKIPAALLNKFGFLFFTKTLNNFQDKVIELRENAETPYTQASN